MTLAGLADELQGMQDVGKTRIRQTGEHGAIQACGKCLSLLMICLLISASVSHFSSFDSTILSSSRNCKHPKENGRMEGEGLDGTIAVLWKNKRRVSLNSCDLLTTILVSRCHGTIFVEDWTGSAWEEQAGTALGSMRAALEQGKSTKALKCLACFTNDLDQT